MDKIRKWLFLPIASAVLCLSACGQPQIQVNYLPVSTAGKARYTVHGLVMVPAYYEGVTKPYTDEYMKGVCLDGYDYKDLEEALNKEMGVSVWVQWIALLECK